MEKLVLFSSGEFGAIFLKGIIKKGLKPALVITKEDKPKGRKKLLSEAPAKTAAKKFNLKIASPSSLKEPSFLEGLKKYREGLFLVVDYGKIIPEEILEIPKFKTLNIHPSLLPKYRGPTPIQTAILNGEKITGITLHLVTEKLDAGEIVFQKSLKLSGKENYLELEEKLAKLSAEIFVKVLPDWIKGKIKPKKQNEVGATYTKKFIFKDGEILPCQETAEIIERKTRALNPEPGVYVKVKKKEKEVILKIFEVEILNQKSKDCSKFFEFEKKLALNCQDRPILIKTLQLEGKKPMDSKNFLAGNKWILN